MHSETQEGIADLTCSFDFDRLQSHTRVTRPFNFRPVLVFKCRRKLEASERRIRARLVSQKSNTDPVSQ